jgi:hypothetical protein
MSMPVQNGANNSTDTLVTPWNIPGWNAQSIPMDSIEVTPGVFSAAPFPASVMFAQVTAPYYDLDSNPLSGFLTFWQTDNATLSSGGQSFRLPARYAARDNSNLPGGMNNWGTGRIYIRRGMISVTLLCTDNTGLVTDSGNPLTYHVVEHFLGGQQFDISVPSSTVSPSDLRSLVVSGTVKPYAYNPADPMASEG